MVRITVVSVKATGKSLIIRGVARPLLTVSVKASAKSFMFKGVAHSLLTVSLDLEDMRWRH
jgi:hypothetical protein